MIYITLQRIWEVLPKPKVFKQLASAVFRHIAALSDTPSLECYVLVVSRTCSTSKLVLLPVRSLSAGKWWVSFLLSEEHSSKVQIPDLLVSLWSVRSIAAGSEQAAERGSQPIQALPASPSWKGWCASTAAADSSCAQSWAGILKWHLPLDTVCCNRLKCVWHLFRV